MFSFPSLSLPSPEETDFSDNNYQNQLPYHARSTATQVLNNTLDFTSNYT